MTDMPLRFNPMQVVERLERGGFTHDQAVAQADVLADIVNVDTLDAATRTDLQATERKLQADLRATEHKLQGEIHATENKLQAEIRATENKLQAEIRATENKLQAGIHATENKLQANIVELEYKLRAEITDVRHKLAEFQKVFEGHFNLLRWMMGFVLAGMAGFAYKLFTLPLSVG